MQCFVTFHNAVWKLKSDIVISGFLAAVIFSSGHRINNAWNKSLSSDQNWHVPIFLKTCRKPHVCKCLWCQITGTQHKTFIRSLWRLCVSGHMSMRTCVMILFDISGLQQDGEFGIVTNVIFLNFMWLTGFKVHGRGHYVFWKVWRPFKKFLNATHLFFNVLCQIYIATMIWELI